MSIVSTKPITAEQLYEMGDIGRCELIEGAIVYMAPSGFEHGGIALKIGALLHDYVRSRKLGVVVAAETGFRIRRNPDTVRAPDVAFVRQERLSDKLTTHFFPGAPDLAVEVLSPSDRKADVLAKAKQWLASGTQSVWVVEPLARTIDVYRVNGSVTSYSVSEDSDDESVLPGFTLRLSDVFAIGS
jgi:Uma2 family endonuclease